MAWLMTPPLAAHPQPARALHPERWCSNRPRLSSCDRGSTVACRPPSTSCPPHVRRPLPPCRWPTAHVPRPVRSRRRGRRVRPRSRGGGRHGFATWGASPGEAARSEALTTYCAGGRQTLSSRGGVAGRRVAAASSCCSVAPALPRRPAIRRSWVTRGSARDRRGARRPRPGRAAATHMAWSTTGHVRGRCCTAARRTAMMTRGNGTARDARASRLPASRVVPDGYSPCLTNCTSPSTRTLFATSTPPVSSA